MSLVEDFVARYKKEYDFYDQAARLVSQLLERNLQSAGIRAMVTFRAKSPSRLEAKVRQRSAEKNYQSLDDIYKDIVDLAGVRVALYFPGERDQIGKIIRQLFSLGEEPKEFPGPAKSTYEKRFSGYWATHYRVRLRESTLNDAQKRYVDALVEIQIASVLMHAWAEVEHDLVYKPMQGRLSDDEYAILDELNGLVMTGEIALERLQKAGEARVSAHARFANHFDLAAYLLDRATPLLKGPASEAVLGRIDVLYNLLEQLNLSTPEGLEPFLATLTGDTERRPLAEQIIDQLLTEDAGRYKTYEELREVTDRESGFLSQDERLTAPEIQRAIGQFLAQWISFERMIREKATAPGFEGRRIGFPTARVLSELQLFDEETSWEIDRIRRLRNNLVHGIEIPDVAEINEASRRLEAILQSVRKPKAVSSISRKRTRGKRQAG